MISFVMILFRVEQLYFDNHTLHIYFTTLCGADVANINDM